MSSSPGQRGRRWWISTIGGSAVAVALIAAGMLGGTGAFDPAPRDMTGRPVQVHLDARPRPEASAVPDGHGRFRADSVGLDVPLGSLDAVEGEITPPGFTSAYLVRTVGVTPDRAGVGAVYVVMHSLSDGVGPGNALIDVAARRASIEVGATITVDDVAYTVTGSSNVVKGELAESDIWTAGPGTLVVITCLQRSEGGPSLQNVVITAVRR